ncbi:hypothetical protein EYF80_002151 [Liparis tanakae]|uniref:Uncharacterized protein n=1 Tax=Liparis tanakae TaxID=230148 RepID=A0A4Z2JC80_9TELE|nr:hypothetical protein EYF80_002151 [Liparis tanakae]
MALKDALERSSIIVTLEKGRAEADFISELWSRMAVNLKSDSECVSVRTVGCIRRHHQSANSVPWHLEVLLAAGYLQQKPQSRRVVVLLDEVPQDRLMEQPEERPTMKSRTRNTYPSATRKPSRSPPSTSHTLSLCSASTSSGAGSTHSCDVSNS